MHVPIVFGRGGPASKGSIRSGDPPTAVTPPRTARRIRYMVSVLCLLALAGQDSAALEQKLFPTDDVWIYQFAQDQTSDPYLRVWGTGDAALGSSFEGHLPFSFSMLKFELPAAPEGSKLTGAKLVLTHSPEPGWTGQDAEKNPVEARSLTIDWNEANWEYDTAKKVHPSNDEATVYGTGWSKPPAGEDKFKVEIDLTKGKGGFQAAYDKALASPSKDLAIALTSKLTPEGGGEGMVYKFYSRSNDEALRPQLVLTFSK